MSSNQFVNNSNPPTDTNQSYFPFKSIDCDLFERNESNNIFQCDYVDNLIKDQLISDNLINNQLISNGNQLDKLDKQLNNNHLNTDKMNNQLNSHLNNELSNQLNNQLNNAKLIINQQVNGQMLINDVLNDVLIKCSNQSSSEDEFQDEKCLDQARQQNNDSALSMCSSSDDSVIMITKFESLAKIIKDQTHRHPDFNHFNHHTYELNNDNNNKNSTSVTPSSFDQQIQTTTCSSFSSIEQNTTPNSYLSEQSSDQVNKSSLNDQIDKDKTLTNEQQHEHTNQDDEEEWNFDTKRNSTEDYLLPLKEDLTDWIIRIFDDLDDLNADNFINKLDNGVIICKLAKHIEEQTEPQFAQLTSAGQSGKPLHSLFSDLLKQITAIRSNRSTEYAQTEELNESLNSESSKNEDNLSSFTTPTLQRQQSKDKLKRGSWTTASHLN